MGKQLAILIAETLESDSDLLDFLDESEYDFDVFEAVIPLLSPESLIILIKQVYCHYEYLFLLTINRLTELIGPKNS
jgi:hypothetical protein